MLIIRKFLPTFFLLLISILLNYLVKDNQIAITSWYTHNVYTHLDVFLGKLTNLFPISIGDLFYAITVFTLLYFTIKYVKTKKYGKMLILYVNSILFFLITFQLFWGLNNYKSSLVSEVNLDVNYTKADLDTITEKLINHVNKQHLAITTHNDSVVKLKKNLHLFNELARANYNKLPDHLQKILISNNINEVKSSMYSKLLSYTGFSGYFNPFTHENQINIEIPTIGMPITVAHEMAHQLGIASEAEANFYGYQVMALSEDVVYQYAANLYALKYCLNEYSKENEETYQILFKKLNLGVQQNILESEAFWQSKRTVSSFFFKHLYGVFLKINNQKDGIKSYNRFVDILINYNKKYETI